MSAAQRRRILLVAHPRRKEAHDLAAGVVQRLHDAGVEVVVLRDEAAAVDLAESPNVTMADEDRAAVNEMLSDLNDLLEKHRRGEDTQQDFDEFMAKHGDFFPENPQDIDELLDALAARAAAAQRMLNSMTPEQREQLMELSMQAFGSPALMEQLARMDANLQALRKQPLAIASPVSGTTLLQLRSMRAR